MSAFCFKQAELEWELALGFGDDRGQPLKQKHQVGLWVDRAQHTTWEAGPGSMCGHQQDETGVSLADTSQQDTAEDSSASLMTSLRSLLAVMAICIFLFLFLSKDLLFLF